MIVGVGVDTIVCGRIGRRVDMVVIVVRAADVHGPCPSIVHVHDHEIDEGQAKWVCPRLAVEGGGWR